MNTLANVLATVAFILVPVFFATTALLGILLYVQHNKNQSHLRDGRKMSNEKQILALRIRALENRIETLSKNAIEDFCLRWCKEVESANYSSEIEVEIKFIYLFMRFLGYGNDDLKTRVSIGVPVGRQKVTGIADWVVYNHRQGKPFLVIEAKEPNQQLTNVVQEQARSYAFALSAPYYMLTNGREIVVFERKVDDDVRVLALSVKDLPRQWQAIEQVIGKR